MPPTLRLLTPSAGNPLANTVSRREANDQSDYTGGHCSGPPLPSRLVSLSSIRRPVRERRAPRGSGQQRPSLIGCASLPRPTIAPVQIEQTSTGVIVAP